jgi:hypothetical protein
MVAIKRKRKGSINQDIDSFVSFLTKPHSTKANKFNVIENGTMVALANTNKAIWSKP